MLNEKKKSTVETCGFSYVSLGDLPLSFHTFKDLNFTSKKLPENINVDELMKVIKNYNNLTQVSSTSDLQVFLFINAVICHICGGFQDLLFNYEREVTGSYVLASGRFELVMINKKTRNMICLAGAKKFDLDQGTAQCLIGCEAVSDYQQSSSVYGIVTNYFQWIFYASNNDGIYKHETASIGCDGYSPNSRDQFALLLTDIYSFVCMVME